MAKVKVSDNVKSWERCETVENLTDCLWVFEGCIWTIALQTNLSLLDEFEEIQIPPLDIYSEEICTCAPGDIQKCLAIIFL